MLRRAVFTAALLASCAGLLMLAGSIFAGTKKPTAIALVPAGRTAIEVVGVAKQSGGHFDSVGYVTHIVGFPDAALFTDTAARDEAHARFTFSATSEVTGRSVLKTLFVLTFSGPTSFYYNAAGGGDFANPATFAQGKLIADFTTRVHDVANVQSPNVAIVTAAEELRQRVATPFAVRGKRYVLGEVGTRLRLDGTGEASRTSIVPLASEAAFAAVITATG
jgi:hypothetical protein